MTVRIEKRLLWGVIWGMTVMMRMTPPRRALPMHSLTHQHGRAERTHAAPVGEAAATKAGGPSLICHKNFRVFATDGSLFVANGWAVRIVFLASQLPAGFDSRPRLPRRLSIFRRWGDHLQ